MMADLIDRQAAIEEIARRDTTDGTIKVYSGREVVKILNELPSAQPEIIRCKDCKNWDMTWTNDFSPNYHYCPMVDGVRKEDWFCADAEERRTDD